MKPIAALNIDENPVNSAEIAEIATAKVLEAAEKCQSIKEKLDDYERNIGLLKKDTASLKENTDSLENNVSILEEAVAESKALLAKPLVREAPNEDDSTPANNAAPQVDVLQNRFERQQKELEDLRRKRGGCGTIGKVAYIASIIVGIAGTVLCIVLSAPISAVFLGVGTLVGVCFTPLVFLK